MDYLFACDADMLFVDYVGDEILHDRVGTLHPGFTTRRGTYDKNPLSKAYVNEHEGTHYFAGGFYGGTQENFIALLEVLTNNIQYDLNHKIVALWHDESHLNRYFIDHEPTCILNTSYCYAEGRSLPTPPRLVALHKSKTYWRS
jgi:histo-blood group ABO system transferase